MKKFLPLIAILVGLSLVAMFLLKKEKQSDKFSVAADRGFTIESINILDKIVIKHKKLQPIVFTKKGKNWIMNEKYDVDPAVFINIEKVLTNMKLLYVPAKAAAKTIKESIASNGIQVDLYNGGASPFKIFFIGSDTQKGDGTFMMLNGDSQPYAMQLPGLSGGLRSRFEQPAKNFRDKFIYKFPANQIASVQIEYPMDNQYSCIIDNKSVVPSVSALSKNIEGSMATADVKKIKNYIAKFENLGTEALYNDFEGKDSVISQIPNCIVTLNLSNKTSLRYRYFGYDEFIEKSTRSKSPGELRYQNRVFILSDDHDLYVAQNRVFGGIFLGYKDFLGPLQK
jgi:hypothetical protein